ncbi:MAG: isochorismatase family protein [Azospirillum sp.]|nr:isochorismatase family protein [Azospirillum sp.]
MALPRIADYPLPTLGELPPVRMAWRIAPRRAALLIHDMQAYFIRAFAPAVPPIAPVLANILALRARCDALDMPVFYSAQPGRQTPCDRGLQSDFWGPGMDDAPDHRDIVGELAPGERHHLVTKWRYSAFQRTNLEPMLHARGRDQLIVCGVYAHIGCLLTTAEAFMRDIQPFLVADAVADFSRAKHDLAVTYAAERCAAVTTTAALLDQLQR